jgi:hypothetical protein
MISMAFKNLKTNPTTWILSTLRFPQIETALICHVLFLEWYANIRERKQLLCIYLKFRPINVFCMCRILWILKETLPLWGFLARGPTWKCFKKLKTNIGRNVYSI